MLIKTKKNYKIIKTKKLRKFFQLKSEEVETMTIDFFLNEKILNQKWELLKFENRIILINLNRILLKFLIFF